VLEQEGLKVRWGSVVGRVRGGGRGGDGLEEEVVLEGSGRGDEVAPKFAAGQ